MRLEFDKQGYVCCILYGCESGSCVEYTGLVPTQPEEYKDIDDWADRAQTQAYKLNEEGNLTYDSGRAAELAARPECVPNEYRNTETLVDKLWINKKPIYRRILQGNATKGAATTIGEAIAGLETVVNIQGMITMSDTGTQVPLTYAYNGEEVVVGVKSDGSVYVNSYKAGSVFVIIDYTKSTD